VSGSTPAPEALLEDWAALGLPFAERPRLGGRLAGGRSNASWVLEAEGRRYVLRLDGAAMPGVDRERERPVLARAGAAGLGPAVVFHDSAAGILVTEYLDLPLPAAPAGAALGRRLVALIERTHGLAATDLAPNRYAPELTGYREALAAHGRDPQARQPERHAAMMAWAHWLDADAAGGVLCHHDPCPGNVLGDARMLRLLDWEYAAPGHRLFDWAVLHCEWQLPFEALPPGAGEHESLARTVALYHYLCELWHALAACAAGGQARPVRRL